MESKTESMVSCCTWRQGLNKKAVEPELRLRVWFEFIFHFIPQFSWESVELAVCWKTFQHEALHPASSYWEAISCSAHLLTLTAWGLAVKANLRSVSMRNFNLGQSLHSKHTYLICFLLADQSELRMDSCLRHNRGLLNKKQRVLKCQRAIPRLVWDDLVMQNVLLHQLHLTLSASRASLLPHVVLMHYKKTVPPVHFDGSLWLEMVLPLWLVNSFTQSLEPVSPPPSSLYI